MLVIMTTTASAYAFPSPYDFAIVKIEEVEAILLASYFKLLDAPEVIEIVFSTEITCEFFSFEAWPIPPGQIGNDLEDYGYAIIPDDIVLPFSPKDAHEPAEIELVLSKEVSSKASDFYWRAEPRGSDHSVFTASLPRTILAQML